MSWRTSSERAAELTLGGLVIVAGVWWVLEHVAGWVA